MAAKMKEKGVFGFGPPKPAKRTKFVVFLRIPGTGKATKSRWTHEGDVKRLLKEYADKFEDKFRANIMVKVKWKGTKKWKVYKRISYMPSKEVKRAMAGKCD